MRRSTGAETSTSGSGSFRGGRNNNYSYGSAGGRGGHGHGYGHQHQGWPFSNSVGMGMPPWERSRGGIPPLHPSVWRSFSRIQDVEREGPRQGQQNQNPSASTSRSFTRTQSVSVEGQGRQHPNPSLSRSFTRVQQTDGHGQGQQNPSVSRSFTRVQQVEGQGQQHPSVSTSRSFTRVQQTEGQHQQQQPRQKQQHQQPSQNVQKKPFHNKKMGSDDFDSLSVTDSGVFSDNDACSSGRASPIVSCKDGTHVDRDRFAILTYDQVTRVDSVLNEMVALEGRGNFPALELKLKDLLTAVKERLVQEGIKIRDIRLNGGAASYALKDRYDYCCVCGMVYQPTGSGDGGLVCSCPGSGSEHSKNFSYNDIDLIFGMELTTVKHFDRVKTAVLDALLDLLPPEVSRKRMSPCALKEAYVSKMVKVCEGDRWSLIALGNGPAVNSNSNTSTNSRSCSVELKFVDTMRRQYEFSVDSFQIVLDSLMLFYKCSTIPMDNRFYPTVVGESVFGDFYGALYHLQNGLIATRHPEEIRGGGLLKYCNLLVRGYRPSDVHSVPPLQRYMCSRFFIDFPEIEQQESKLRTYLVNHMSGGSSKLRYAFLITLYHVVDSSTVCLMGHERRLTLHLIQRLACELFTTADSGLSSSHGIYGPQPLYSCYPTTTYYMPSASSSQCSSTTSTPAASNSTSTASLESTTIP